MTLPANLPALRLLTVVLTVGVLWLAQDVVVPLVVSLLVSYALEPAVARLEAWHVRRVVGVPILIATLHCERARWRVRDSRRSDGLCRAAARRGAAARAQHPDAHAG